jgi:pilus assembly protein FimV
MGAIDSHEVDPIAEAEVYMAYGRDAQAEEILREALGKDPSRHEIALKLLELYASRKDTTGFETTASELYAGMGGQNTPVWQRAAEMGRSIDAQNPLYRVATPQASAAAAPVAATVAAAAAVAVSAAMAESVSAPEKPASAKPAATELADLETLASMDDWGDAAKTSGNEIEFSSSLGSDFDQQPAAPVAAPLPAAATVSPPAHDNLMKFESPSLSQPEAGIDMAEPEIKLSAAEPASASNEVAPEPVTLDMPDDFGLEFEAEAEPAAPEQLATAMLSNESDGLDFLAEDTPAEIEAMPVLDLSGIDLDLDVEHLPEAEEFVAPEAESAEAHVAAPVLEAAADFDPFAEVAAADFEPVQTLPAEPEVEAPAVAAPEVKVESGISPELREEVNTKLDLARAYLEMGDREGAREILQEVLGEGADDQKAEASKLMVDAG